MPALTIETQESEKPILFIIGEKNPLIPYLIEEYGKDFKIAQISHTAHNDSNIYHVTPANSALIKNLKEKIEYAIVFCENQNIKEYLGPVFDKLATDHTKTVVVCPIEKVHEFVDVAKAVEKLSKASFLISGDIYSEIPTFNPSSETAEIIDSVIHKKRITFRGNDLKPMFPIYYKDAIAAISKMILGHGEKGDFYYLFYDHPQTQLSAVHILQRFEPDLRVEYSQVKVHEEFSDFGEVEKYVKDKLSKKPKFLDKYLEGFEKSIAHFVARGPLPEYLEKESKLSPKKVVTKHKSKINRFLKAGLIALFLFIVIEVVAGASSILLLNNSVSEFKKGNFKDAAGSAKSAKAFFEISNPAGKLISKSASAVGAQKIESDYKLLSEAVNLTSIATADAESLSRLSEGLRREELERVIADALYLYFTSQNVAGSTNNKVFENIPTEELSKILTVAQVAPQVLGYDGEKHYLLLFQNNGELRPTGGFIGSVGEATVKNGRVTDFNVQDVYEYDGQLKNHIEPHFIVRRYIQPHLYLRDSNFDPDFQKSASAAALLYNLETGRKVDGVIGVNFEAVRQIIGAAGPVDLTSYKKTLNSDNAFSFLQETIDSNFFPGSTQKRDVLQALYDKLMLNLEEKGKEQKVMALIPQLIAEKNIIFAFSKASVQNAFSAVGMGGEIKDNRKIEAGKINDFLAINEANIAVNKANININHSTDYTATLAPTKLTSKITHRIENRDKKNYRSYIRIFTPLGSKLNSIIVNGARQNIVAAVTDFSVYERRNFNPPAGLEVDETSENGKTAFGFIVDIPPESDGTIEVEYDNGADVPNVSIVDYSLLLLKQPGVEPYPFTLNIVYGNTFTPKQVSGARFENGVVVVDRMVKTDAEFEAEFLKR